MKKLKENPRLFTIRAYCSKCGKLLLVSNPMNKKELMANWDKAVLDAPGIVCKDCGTTVPNFNLDLKIYNSGSKMLMKPEVFFPKPVNPFDPNTLFK